MPLAVEAAERGGPDESGHLEVGDGHRLHWEAWGDPGGKPAVVLHGGPGGGSGPWARRLFDPKRYRVVAFDQRGCGRSTPHASDPAVDLSTNTTPHLVADCEGLRRYLGLDGWLVLGGSWGSTLALAYAQAHPDRVSELVLFSVGTTTRREVEWVTRSMGRMFPEEWSRFVSLVPDSERDGDLAAAYARLLADPDPDVPERAARAWCEWEDTHVTTGGTRHHDPRYDDPRFRMAFARLVTHYWSHAGFFPDGQLLAGAHRLRSIPGALVHGRHDISSPPDIAWALAQRWPDATLELVDGGHGAGQVAIARAVAAATARFAS